MPLAEALVPVAMLRENDTQESDTKASAKTPADKPKLAYLTPHSTPANTLEQSEILFPVNKSTINPAYMNNAAHIEQMQNFLKQGGNIKEIHLMGYASPEGPYPFNEALAAKRAEAVKQHLKGCNLPADVKISTNSSPADWAAVRQKLSESFIENYLKIIAIIDDPAIAPADKNKVIKEKYPVEYDFMLRVWYPQMRKTDISFAGEKKMTIDEAKAQLQQDPAKLSLEDIYMIALTYEKGSKEWEDIIIIAVDTYPQSPEARINAANVAMANGNFKQAATYLDGVPSNIPQAMNSRGILAMEEGRYQDAMQLFQAAEQAGVGEATQNIALLKQLEATENQ
jgi:outer membrane protein OmpA-like peptidoglycan-associated protein